jgi:Integrase core domain
VLTARTEVTNRMLIFSERHLRIVMARYARHYNGRRPHRALQLQPPSPTTPRPISPVNRSSAGPSSAASSTNTSEPLKDQVTPEAQFWHPTGCSKAAEPAEAVAYDTLTRSAGAAGAGPLTVTGPLHQTQAGYRLQVRLVEF